MSKAPPTGAGQTYSMEPEQAPEPLTGKEVGDYSKNVAKDVAKTTLVWTLAGTLTTLIRDLCKYLASKVKS